LRARLALCAWSLAILACGDRGCGVKQRASTALADRDEPRLSLRAMARCRTEVAQSAVAVVSGTGPFASLHATCDDGELSAWVVRSHTLSRTQRALREGSSWTPSTTVASGVEGLSVLASSLGPIAWRAPTAAIEGMDSEEWWAMRRPDARSPWQRGSLGFTRALQSRGILAAIEHERGAVSALASVVGEDDTEARLVRVAINVDGDAGSSSTQNQAVPERIGSGDLRAYAQSARVALVERVEGQGPSATVRIEALALEGAGVRSRGAHTISSATAIVTAQGAGTRDEAGFALASFTRARRGESGCLPVGEGLCVLPGPLLFARVTAAGMRVTEVAREGLADSIAIEPDGRGYILLYVAVESGRPVQSVARVALDGTLRERWPLRARGLPPIDRPVLVACGEEPWLVGEALVGEPDEDGGAQESGVIAVPLECVRE
jgi:hypothetical protein